MPLINNSFANRIASCDNTEEFKVITTKIDGDYSEVIKGCIRDSTILKLSIENTIYALKRGTFADMLNLKTIFLRNFAIKTLEPGFITNSPKLEEIIASDDLIQHIFTGVFNGMNLKRLILNSNRIYFIEEGAFANMNASWLGLTDNKLSRIQRNWFQNTFIRKLDLHYNQITSLDADIFGGIKNLSAINLNYNRISWIDPKCFSNLTNLQELYLAGNGLKEMQFLGDLSVQTLDIGFNMINYLSLNENSTKISTILFYPNPWSCACLMEFWRYVWKNKIGLEASKTLQEPLEIRSKPICVAVDGGQCSYKYYGLFTRIYLSLVNYKEYGAYRYDSYSEF